VIKYSLDAGIVEESTFFLDGLKAGKETWNEMILERTYTCTTPSGNDSCM
jgi:hypothetical protein